MSGKKFPAGLYKHVYPVYYIYMTTTTTTLIQPTPDEIVELSYNACWYLVTVDWEYDSEVYVMSSSRADCIAIDFTPRVVALPRDEGFVITDVKLIR